MATPVHANNRAVHVIDATERPLGRIATQVATLLMGKNKASFTPNTDRGDFVHVKNAAKIRLTGKKEEQKVYKWYTGFQGGLRSRKISVVKEKNPGEMLERAVKNMLPKNTHQTPRLRRLRVTN
ncbi:50S ribosomal protein L13 [Patescibacteria group bacterium]|nr:50S ribosomal protein L13 [Patescibacteria group bacterium]